MDIDCVSDWLWTRMNWWHVNTETTERQRERKQVNFFPPVIRTDTADTLNRFILCKLSLISFAKLNVSYF